MRSLSFLRRQNRIKKSCLFLLLTFLACTYVYYTPNYSTAGGNTNRLLLRTLDDHNSANTNVLSLSQPTMPTKIFVCSDGKYIYNLILALFPNFDIENSIVHLEWTDMPWNQIKYTKEQQQVAAGRNNMKVQDKATSTDLFISNLLKSEICLKDPMNFPGKSLYFNVEPIDYIETVPGGLIKKKNNTTEKNIINKYDYLPESDKIFVLGPHEDTKTSMQYPYISQVMFMKTRSEKEKFFNHEEKPINTGEHFLMYPSNHYRPEREHAIHKLYEINNDIHTFGKCEGNLLYYGQPTDSAKITCNPYKDEDRPQGIMTSPYMNDVKTYDDNYKIFKHYRYTLAFENRYRDGYITEKILNAFLGGSVPIYFGTRDIFKIFNRKAFIYYDINNPQEALERISYLESHPDEYAKMLLEEPILVDGTNTIEEYFSLGLQKGDYEDKVKERILRMLGFDSDSKAGRNYRDPVAAYVERTLRRQMNKLDFERKEYEKKESGKTEEKK